ncbi:hypothetical protein MMC08_008647 [Hypocenomyce scalaris]|nr:hypothetical protein [Hypocenomyce scalaris]
MVRLKNRYLLLHILYPEPPETDAQNPLSKPAAGLPDVVQFHRPSPDDLSPQLLARMIKEQISHLYGDYGAGITFGRLVGTSTHSSAPLHVQLSQLNNIGVDLHHLAVKYFSPATSTAIIRCSRAHYRLVWAALSFITQLPKASRNAQPRPCVLQVVRVSGTIKKAEEETIRRARVAILKAKRSTANGVVDGLEAILDDPGKGRGRDGNEENTTMGIEDDDEDEDDEESSGG